jgi:hypothetical protein
MYYYNVVVYGYDVVVYVSVISLARGAPAPSRETQKIFNGGDNFVSLGPGIVYTEAWPKTSPYM